MNNNEKKVCLLTGASGRLGTQFCQRHADKYHIVAVYRRRPPQVPSQMQTLVDPLAPEAVVAANQHPVYAVQADLTNESDLNRVVEVTLARFDQIDLLVNAAFYSQWGPLVDSNAALMSMENQFLTNVMVPVRLATLIARNFWRDRVEENGKRNRHVLNISSSSGSRVYSGSGQSVYSASKAALNFMTWHLAEEFRPLKVRVNAVAPTSFPRIISTESVADAIVKLDSGPLTGKVLLMDQDGTQLLAKPTL